MGGAVFSKTGCEKGYGFREVAPHKQPSTLEMLEASSAVLHSQADQSLRDQARSLSNVGWVSASSRNRGFTRKGAGHGAVTLGSPAEAPR